MSDTLQRFTPFVRAVLARSQFSSLAGLTLGLVFAMFALGFHLHFFFLLFFNMRVSQALLGLR